MRSLIGWSVLAGFVIIVAAAEVVVVDSSSLLSLLTNYRLIYEQYFNRDYFYVLLFTITLRLSTGLFVA